ANDVRKLFAGPRLGDRQGISVDDAPRIDVEARIDGEHATSIKKVGRPPTFFLGEAPRSNVTQRDERDYCAFSPSALATAVALRDAALPVFAPPASPSDEPEGPLASTHSMSEIGAPSPRRGPTLMMRVYPPGRSEKRLARSTNTFSTRSTLVVTPALST